MAQMPAAPAGPVTPTVPTAAEIQAEDAARRALLHAISPAPSALRREPPPAEVRGDGEAARRRSDASSAIPRLKPQAAAATPAPVLTPTTQPKRVVASPTDETMRAPTNEPFAENTAVEAPPIMETTARSPRQDLFGGSAESIEGPTMRYPTRAPSPSPGDTDDPDAATRLNAIRRPERSAAVPPPTPQSMRAQPSRPLPLQAAPSVVAPVMFPADPADTQPTAAPGLAPVVPILPIAPGHPREIKLRPHTPTGVDPPSTRIQRPEQLADRPFTPPKVLPIPEIPEPGLIQSARYATRFARARYQRRGAIKVLGVEIKQDTEALDQVLGALGREAREAKVEGRVFSAENAAILAAEQRVQSLHREHTEVDARKADEGSKFVDIERDRNSKLAEAERAVEEAQRELGTLEAQRRGLRDKRKEIERRQKAYLKASEDHNRQAGAAQMGDQRSELRRAAELHSKEAAALEPERQDIDRRLAALERPIGEATAKLDAAKAELDAAKRSLNDAREGHTHRLAELDSEHKRKAREIGLAEGEIARRLVTLGTLVNLNRIEDPKFAELYQRIDRLRGAITARTTEIERLTAERDAYDRGTLVRGVVAIGAAIVVLIAFVVILRAIL
jgi:hypothetical protein